MRLLLLGITETHTARAISRAQRLGCEVFLGDSAERLAACAPLVSHADRLIPLEFRNAAAIASVVDELQRSGGIDAIFSFKEEALLPVAHVQHDYNMVGNSVTAVQTCIDKARTHQKLGAASIPHAPFALCETAEEAAVFADAHGLPIILKPHNLQGSVGVVRVDDSSDLEAAFHACRNQCRDGLVLAEEFILGREMSMEGLVHRGEAVLLAVTEKRLFPDTFVESGHLIPYDGEDVSYPCYAELLDRVVSALGITIGPLHIEFFLTGSGPVIGEIHTRYGGGCVPTLLERALGFDVHTPVFAELLGLPGTIVPDPWRSPQATAAVRFFEPPVGILQAVDGMEEARRVPGVVELEIPWQPGDEVCPIRSSHDRGGWVIAEGRSRDDVEATLEEAMRLVGFTSRPPIPRISAA